MIIGYKIVLAYCLSRASYLLVGFEYQQFPYDYEATQLFIDILVFAAAFVVSSTVVNSLTKDNQIK